MMTRQHLHDLADRLDLEADQTDGGYWDGLTYAADEVRKLADREILTQTGFPPPSETLREQLRQLQNELRRLDGRRYSDHYGMYLPALEGMADAYHNAINLVKNSKLG